MSSSDELTEHAARNRAYWDRTSDWYQEANARFIERGLAWGLWQIPESELNVLGDVIGKDVLELGCGAAEWSRALARIGARPVGLDNSEARLARAREAGADFPLVQRARSRCRSRTAQLRRGHVRLGRDNVRRSVPRRPGGRAGVAAGRALGVLGLVATRLGLLRQGIGHVCAAARQRLLRPPSLRRSRRGDGVQPHLRRMDRGLLQERVRGRGPDRDPAAAGRDLDVPKRGRDGVGMALPWRRGRIADVSGADRRPPPLSGLGLARSSVQAPKPAPSR